MKKHKRIFAVTLAALQMILSVTIALGETVQLPAAESTAILEAGSTEINTPSDASENNSEIQSHEEGLIEEPENKIINSDSGQPQSLIAASQPTNQTAVKLEITQQPQDQCVKNGKIANLSVQATGEGLSYRWQFRTSSSGTWQNTGATRAQTANERITAIAGKNDGWQFRCVITDSYGNTVTSNPLTLTIKPELVITKQPTNQAAKSGETVTFSAKATGDGLTYSWQQRAENETSWTYSDQYNAAMEDFEVEVSPSTNGMRYRCVIVDSDLDKLITDEVTLTMTFGITEQPKDQYVKSGKTALFSVKAVGDGLIYQWQYHPKSGGVWADTGKPASKENFLELSKFTSANDGLRLRCIITDSEGDTLTSDEATLTIKPDLVITQQPENRKAKSGENVTFSVKASGDELNYQWQQAENETDWKNCSFTTANTADLEVPVNSASNGMNYYCVITDSDGDAVTTDAVTLTMTFGIIEDPTNQAAKNGKNVTFSVKAIGEGLTYQWQYHPKSGGTWTDIVTSKPSTAEYTHQVKAEKNDGMQFRCVITDSEGATAASNAATLSVKPELAITAQPKDQAAKSGKIATFSVEAAGDGLQYQWQYQEKDGSGWADSLQATAKASELKVTVISGLNGLKYRCLITDSDKETIISNEASLTVKPALEIVTQPEDHKNEKKNSTVSFSVEATGDGLTYQWQELAKNGSSWTDSVLETAKTAKLKVTVTSSLSGTKYRCIVADSDGDQLSTAEVTLTVKSSDSSSGSGSSSGGGGSVSSGTVSVGTVSTGNSSFSNGWYVDSSSIWRYRRNNGTTVSSCWLCDDAVAANEKNVWYLIGDDGGMIACGLVRDNTGNFYSLETEHNGYFGMLRYKDGYYRCGSTMIYITFSREHNGSFGAVTNQAAIDALTAAYGVINFPIDNSKCFYTSNQ